MDEGNLWVTAPVEGLDSNEVRGYTFPDYIREHVDKHGWGDAVAFESAETGKRLTYTQVLKDSRALAAGLLKLRLELNLQRQDVVGVILPNLPEYISIIFGIWEAGLVATPINPSCVERDIARQLEQSNSKIIVTFLQFLPVARSIQLRNPNIIKIIVLGSDESVTREYCLNYLDLLQTETEADGLDYFTGSELTAENDTALLPFSSGTSGLPKGVMLTHFAILSNAYLTSHPSVIGMKRFNDDEGSSSYSPQEKYFAILPFFHIYGLQSTLASMIQGAHAMTFAAFKPALFIRKLVRFKPTVLNLVPTLVSFLANTDMITSSDLEQVHYIASGAAPAGEVLVTRLLDKAKNATFVEGYGLTEVGGLLTLCRTPKMGSIGQPHPEMTVKIVNTTTGATLGVGERGELCAKSPSVMKGYLNNEEATKECIDSDGWLHTGDIAYYDEGGFLFIVDRLKELIKVKGFQVAPSELEEVIRSHEKVADVAVIGIPDDISGEVPRAFVVPKVDLGEEMTEAEIVDFVNGQVSNYKYLRGGVQVVTEIPKSAAGKVLRRVLRDKYDSV